MNIAIERLRNLSALGFEVAMDKIKSKREDGVFVSDTPYTPICLIDELINYKQQSLDIEICVWYTIEMAFRLAYQGYDNISIYLLEEDIEIKKYCDVFGFKYCIIREGNKDMEKKFDLITGNPPFSKTVVSDKNTKGKSVQIWPEFIRNSLELCKVGGTVALIHPNNWRDVGDPYKLWDIMTNKQIHKVRMYGLDKSREFFNIDLKFDYVITENVKAYTSTNIIDIDNNEKEMNVGNLEFIPSAKIDDINKLIAKEGEQRVDLLHDSKYHTQNNGKVIMAEERNEKFKYPCVYVVKNDGGVTCWYSSIIKGHFGIPKVIFANGAASHCVIIDNNGEYGLTQFAKAIVDTEDVLPKIKQALENTKFIDLIKHASCGQNSYDHKLIRLFRKDFWKEFV